MALIKQLESPNVVTSKFRIVNVRREATEWNPRVLKIFLIYNMHYSKHCKLTKNRVSNNWTKLVKFWVK